MNTKHIETVEAILNQDQQRVKRKENDPIYSDVITYLKEVEEEIKRVLGKAGEFWFNYTMVRLGLYTYPKSKEEKIKGIERQLNLQLIKEANIPLPYVKHEGDKIEIGNMILAEHAFTKIDKENHTVEGYANTVICDLVDDLIFPEAYRESAEKLKTTYFMHHTDLPDGQIIESRFDKIGWWVKSQLDEWAWKKVEDGTLTGYSIGGRIVCYPEFVGAVAVFKNKGSVIVDDLSHVTRPCNKLSFFQISKLESNSSCAVKCNGDCNSSFCKMEPVSIEFSQSRATAQLTARTSDTGSPFKKEGKKLSTEQTQQEQVEKSIDEQIAELLKEKEEQAKIDLLRKLKAKKAEEEKAKEESRVAELEKQVGELTSTLNTFMAEVKKTLDTITGKIRKIEEIPEVKPVTPKAEPSLIKTAFESVNFAEFHQKASKGGQ